MNHLNQSIVEQMDTEDIWAWRNSIIKSMGDMSVFLAQLDWVLQQRGEK